MKKFITFALVAVLLCAALCTSAFAAEEKVFWVSHFNDSTAEGAGVIFTETPTEGCQWWVIFAFAPTGTENVYEVTAVVDGTADGTASPMETPEGGFLYGLNTGNDWPTVLATAGATGDGATGQWFDNADYASKPNYINDNNNAAMADAKSTFAVGTKIEITGVDFDTLELPTSTSDKMWYEAGYVCTATYKLFEGDAGDAPATSEAESEEAESEDETSAPAAESKEDTSKTESKADASVADSSDAPAESDGMPMWVIALIVVAVLAVVAVVVVVILKKK